MTKELKIKLGFWGVSACCVAANVFADASADEGDILDLPKVTVVASRVELSSGVVGSSVTTLDLEDLARYENELASDVIRHIEGVYLRNNGNAGSTAGITMRGLPIAPVVLIDGVEVNDPGSGSVFNFGNLPMASIAGIEVLRGAQSALYGSNALTGVISITSKTRNLVHSFHGDGSLLWFTGLCAGLRKFVADHRDVELFCDRNF